MPEQINPQNIKVGDKVRRTITTSDEITVTNKSEGVIYGVDSTGRHQSLNTDFRPASRGSEFRWELINRPVAMPNAKEIWTDHGGREFVVIKRDGELFFFPVESSIGAFPVGPITQFIMTHGAWKKVSE